MVLYAVYSPKGLEPDDAPEALRFVPERASLWALLVPPLLLVLRRMWLALVFWLAAFLAVTAVAMLLAPEVAGLCYLLFWIWFALSARDLEQASLTRAGWRLEAVVEGHNVGSAERRFFERLAAPPPGPFPAPPRGREPFGRPGGGPGPGSIVGFEAFGGAAR